MIFSRRIYFIILIHILLIISTLAIGLWLVVSGIGYIVGSLSIICSLFQIGALVRQLNKFNYKIRVFFDAIQDRDNMLYFPTRSGSHEQKQLYCALNRINDLFLEIKIENQKQEHLNYSLLENVSIGIIAWNELGDVIVANSAAQALLGCSQLINDRQVKHLLEGRKNLSLSQREMKLDSKIVTLLSINDIGDELSDKESESWSALTKVLTHEIMNTIAPIISLSQTLSTYPEMNEKRAKGLQIIHRQSERLMEFTQSFRHLSALAPPQKRVFSLTSQLENLRELLQSDCTENGISLSVKCTPCLIEIDGDESQLSQVFLNLLRNSIQALEGRQNGTILIYAQQLQELLTIEIIDNGSGLPIELHEKIFTPFFTTKDEGSGIGLSLSKQIIRQHLGRIYVKESNSKHTIFKIELPIGKV